MAAIRGHIIYKRNRRTREQQRGQRVFDVTTGFVLYTNEAMRTRGGFVNKNVRPDVDPKSGGYIP